ncbi:helix-turn-helix transcriptional regulator [Halopiger djelfimassiliensis]|uniref:helix-turn-helix transcriptional regulator n=1 Tax=Halopiger djelfimassiliensis TaxID=1293047 RepID=UPI0006782A8C|nr:MarR family transcriptional regulator [Halopiger djelfimassiliensis]
MNARALQRPAALAAAVFVGSTVILAVQLTNPSPVTVTAGGGTEVVELVEYFTYRDVGVATLAACLFGASGTYLLLAEWSVPDPGSTGPAATTERNADIDRGTPSLEARRHEWERTAEELVNNERVIYETVLEADGVIAQTEIVDRTDLSKATVSRTLDTLEAKGLVERERSGMGNEVKLL